jgi:hypothetical protein
MFAPFVGAQTYTISTVAGGGAPIGLAAKGIGFGNPTAVTVNSSGNMYLAARCQIFEIDPGGMVIQTIGNGICGFNDGPASSSQIATHTALRSTTPATSTLPTRTITASVKFQTAPSPRLLEPAPPAITATISPRRTPS